MQKCTGFLLPIWIIRECPFTLRRLRHLRPSGKVRVETKPSPGQRWTFHRYGTRNHLPVVDRTADKA